MQAENLINISFIPSNKIYIENKKTKNLLLACGFGLPVVGGGPRLVPLQ
jgi:hypothetical protein